MMDPDFHYNLVGGLKHEFYLSIQLGIIIPTDFHMFQRGRSTTNQIMIFLFLLRKPVFVSSMFVGEVQWENC